MANLKVPGDLLQRVQRVARQFGVTRTAATIALLGEGLKAAHKLGVGTAGRTKR
ncbi:MAG: hypothetical protein ACE5I7_14975 [Candidatus Binatia bacterium]